MSDKELRELERLARAGDRDVRDQLVRALLREAGSDTDALHAAVVASPEVAVHGDVFPSYSRMLAATDSSSAGLQRTASGTQKNRTRPRATAKARW